MITNNNKKNYKEFCIISYLTEEKGHLINDDLFWVRMLKNQNIEPKIYTSKESINNLNDIFGKSKSLIKFKKNFISSAIPYRLYLLYKLLSIGGLKNKTIIFQGYEEISLLIFLLIKPIYKFNKIILIITNNISIERLRRREKLLTYLTNRIYKHIDYIFYHSDFEYNLLKIILHPNNSLKLRKLKYYAIGEKKELLPKYSKRLIISYFGPSMKSKPLDCICKLIINDREQKFAYNFYRLSESDKIFLSERVGNRSNISLCSEYLESKKYYEVINSSSFVFLPHNKLFEGKLSGILCDCISMHTPIISNKIEPVIEFFYNFGEFGYIYDFDHNNNWYNDFLSKNYNLDIRKFKISILNCIKSHNNIEIIRNFLLVISD